MTERTSDWTKYTLQSFIESPDVVVVGMSLDFLCLCHPPAIAHLAQVVLDLETSSDPSLIMNSGFGLLKVGFIGKVFLMQNGVDFLPVGIKPILMSLVHDAKGGFRGGQDRVHRGGQGAIDSHSAVSVVAFGGPSDGFESSSN